METKWFTHYASALVPALIDMQQDSDQLRKQLEGENEKLKCELEKLKKPSS